MILITGATGHLGATVIDHLLTQRVPSGIAGFARSREKAAHLAAKGIDVRIGEYHDVGSLERAMEGVEKVLLVSSPDHNELFQQHKNVINAAKKFGVSQLAYTGILVKDPSTSPLKSMMEAHFRTEDYLRESGVPFTILRNTLYADAIPIFAGEKIFETGIYLPAGNGAVPFALRREMGEAAANALLEPGHANKTYDITAGKLYSYADVAAILSELLEKKVTYVDIDEASYKDRLIKAGLPPFAIAAISGFITDKKNGQYEILSNDLEMLLGRKPMSLQESLKEIYKL